MATSVPSDVSYNGSGLVQQRYADESAVDLLQYWSVVNQFKWQILALTVVVSVLAYVIVSAMTPIYAATAKLLIESDAPNVVSIEEVYGIDSSNREYFQTQVEILNSRQLAETVVKQLGLDRLREFDPVRQRPSLFSWEHYLPSFASGSSGVQLQDDLAQRTIISTFQRNLSIEGIRNTQIVSISFESTDPELAYRVPNALGESYIENTLESRVQLTRKATDWLTVRLTSMRKELTEAEAALQAFREKEDLVDLSGVESQASRELTDLTSQLADARNRATEARTQFESVGRMSSGFNSAWETLPGVLKDALSQQLKSQEGRAEASFEELAKRYGPKHPKYIAARTQVDSTKSAYRSRVTQVVTGFESAYRSALSDQQKLEQEVARSRAEVQNLNRKRFELSELERKVETNRQLYDMFFKRFRETSEAGFEAANARFVDYAERPFSPVKPRKVQIVAIAGMLSMMFGIMLAFLRAALDNTVRAAEDVEERLGYGVLGVVPLEKKVLKSEQSIGRYYADHPHETFSEAVRSLRTSVVLSSLDKAHKVVVVTSSVPQEGKTTVASNLALALGQMERVLLVDADMRRPALGNVYELERSSSGLSELVAKTNTLSSCIHTLTGMGIDILPAGSVPPNPLDLLSSARFTEVLTHLRDKYDRIIIDTAPTQAVSDSLVLSTHADALIFVVKSDATPAKVCVNALQRLQRVGAPIIGVVLNQFDAEHVRAYGYDGYRKHGYYGYGYASKSYD